MDKVRVNLSLDSDTKERLQQYAWEHRASLSKAVTDLVWAAKVKNSEIRGQMNLDDYLKMMQKKTQKKRK